MKNPIIHTFSSQDVQYKSAVFIAEFLEKELKKGKPIVLLLSGGSAIQMYRQMVDLIIQKQHQLNNLTCSLFDERFVTKGSKDSNGQQLRDAGVIDLLEKNGAAWIPYLSADDTNGEQVAEKITQQFSELLKTHHLIILAGLGEDGHTAGLLPVKENSPNKRIFDSDQLVEYYEVRPQDSDNPFHKRLTATPTLVEQSHQVILYATGQKKSEALQKFLQGSDPTYTCPANALWESTNSPLVLTDLKRVE